MSTTRPDSAIHVSDHQTLKERGVIVVSGIPGAGKSTVSPILARCFTRGVHIEADALQRMILRGGRWPNEGPGGEGSPEQTVATIRAAVWKAGVVA